MPKKKSQNKSDVERSQSPRISRITPELLKIHGLSREWSLIVFNFVIGVLLMGILFVAYDGLIALDTLEIKKQERVIVQEDIRTWENIVLKRPDYRDGYFKLSLLYFQSGERGKAFENLARVKEIDPQFEKIAILEKELQRK